MANMIDDPSLAVTKSTALEQQAIVRIAIFAPQGCSQFSVGIMSEPFLLVNRILGKLKYRLTLITDEKNLHTAVGSQIFEYALFSDMQDYDLLIVAAENPPKAPISLDVRKSLQRYYRQKTSNILSVQAGLWWLLNSGIGLEEAWVVHWSLMDDFKDCFPNTTLSHDLYQSNERLHSCAGQLATLDYIIAFLGAREEKGLVNQVSDHLCIDRVRSGDERQRLPSHSFAGEDLQPRLTMAIDLMEANIEEPLTTEQIAERVSMSRRQLERLFKRYMNTMPSRHYMQIRLKRAHHLLQNSNMSIVQIGLSCGFSSGPHFSSSYKSYFQSTPREERAKCYVGR